MLFNKFLRKLGIKAFFLEIIICQKPINGNNEAMLIKGKDKTKIPLTLSVSIFLEVLANEMQQEQ